MSDQTVDRTELPIRRPPFRGGEADTRRLTARLELRTCPYPSGGRAKHLRRPILTDDAASGNLATFGGPIRTPALDRLAGGGLKYDGFTVTAMCSPTRRRL